MTNEETPEDLTPRILRIIAETQRKDPAQVTIDSSFEELGIDSMDGVNIVFALENEFDINVPDEEVKSIRSVRDMVEGVRTLVEQRNLQSDTPSDRRACRILMRRVVVTGIGVICGVGETTAKHSGKHCGRAVAASARSPIPSVSIFAFGMDLRSKATIRTTISLRRRRT